MSVPNSEGVLLTDSGVTVNGVGGASVLVLNGSGANLNGTGGGIAVNGSGVNLFRRADRTPGR